MSKYIVTLEVTKEVVADSEDEAEDIAINGLGFGICGYEWNDQPATSIEEVED